ncbi:hypothetical protein B0H21DRAFT_730684 [Amylocystis lapponica]|nr:hypothetical protein B0H21DRAFT_730684 [Amylocystis lapponica]
MFVTIPDYFISCYLQPIVVLCLTSYSSPYLVVLCCCSCYICSWTQASQRSVTILRCSADPAHAGIVSLQLSRNLLLLVLFSTHLRGAASSSSKLQSATGFLVIRVFLSQCNWRHASASSKGSPSSICMLRRKLPRCGRCLPTPCTRWRPKSESSGCYGCCRSASR